MRGSDQQPDRFHGQFDRRVDMIDGEVGRRLVVTGALASLAGCATSSASRGRLPVTGNAFGAVGDGRTLATRAIQAAIDHAARGSGHVTLDPGRYLTGALFIRSGVTFEIPQGVSLLGSRDLKDYPILLTRIAGIEARWPAALVNFYEVADARLVGEGVVDGDGKVWWDAYRALRARYEPRGLRWASDYDCMRPRLIQTYRASRIRIEGLMLRRSGFWTVHLCYSRDIRVADVTIRNNEDGRGPSTDGIDVDSSRHVIVERADIACNDDALCIKAGRDADGLRVALPTAHVVFRDCVVREAAAGVTFGSETSGGFHDVLVDGLQVHAPTPTGILFKSARTRGGLGEKVTIRRVNMEGVRRAVQVDMNWNPAYSYARIPADVADPPALWRILAQPVPVSVGPPRLRDISIDGIAARRASQAFSVKAYPEAPLTGFRFSNVEIDAPDGGTIADARDWSFTSTTLASRPVLINAENIRGI